MSNPMEKVLEAIPAVLVAPLTELVKLILDAPNPHAAIERAKYYAAADAAKLAADAALRRDLG